MATRGRRRIITVTCLILQDGTENDKKAESQERADLTVTEYTSWLQSTYLIEGEVSLFYHGEKLNDPYAVLGDILRDDSPLFASNDKAVSIATGGVALGASVVGSNGRAVFAGGGYAEGGAFDDGIMFGGKGIGGTAKGVGLEGGVAGTAAGGTANSTIGDAYGGRGTGGNLIAARNL